MALHCTRKQAAWQHRTDTIQHYTSTKAPLFSAAQLLTLKATLRRFLSSLESSTPVSVTLFMEAAMSSYLQCVVVQCVVVQCVVVQCVVEYSIAVWQSTVESCGSVVEYYTAVW